MNAFEEIRLKILAALLLDYYRPDARLIENEDLAREYHLYVSDQMFNAAVKMARENLSIVETKDGFAAKLKPEGFGTVFGEVTAWIDASSLEVSWKKEEILTDARRSELLPGISGWKVIVYETDATPLASMAAPSFSPSGIHIHNSFSPVNTIKRAPIDERAGRSAARASWLNMWVALALGLAVIAVTLWIGGKL